MKTFFSTKRSKPLRILFCGSDEFSSGSLQALYQEQQRDPAGIKSIDVLCRPSKRVQRDGKSIREGMIHVLLPWIVSDPKIVPIKTVADGLGLRVYQRDTFTGWNLPTPEGEAINLIVAVSFGLFVPPRILKSAEYGGLNVHPSLLPKYAPFQCLYWICTNDINSLRGAAPLQWTIMKGLDTTGVTLQTLDDKLFDHGKILLQTPPINLQGVGLHKPTYSHLRDLVTSHAQQLLVQGIRERVFVPPLHEMPSNNDSTDLIFAGKLKAGDEEIDWTRTSTQIARQYRAMGPLWATMRRGTGGENVRVTLDDIEEVPREERHVRGRLLAVGPNGETSLNFGARKDGSIFILGEHDDLRVGKITLEGKRRVKGREAAETLRVR